MVALLIAMLAVYCGCGVAFALAFAMRGVGVVDPTAQGGSLGFRLLILPGASALWPLLLVRWMRCRRRA